MKPKKELEHIEMALEFSEVTTKDIQWLIGRIKELEFLLKDIAYYSTSCNNCGDCAVCGGGTNDIEFRIKQEFE